MLGLSSIGGLGRGFHPEGIASLRQGLRLVAPKPSEGGGTSYPGETNNNPINPEMFLDLDTLPNVATVTTVLVDPVGYA